MLALLLLGTALCADVEPLRVLMVGLLIECWHCLHAARMLACLAVRCFHVVALPPAFFQRGLLAGLLGFGGGGVGGGGGGGILAQDGL
jgi:hypothetical protein